MFSQVLKKHSFFSGFFFLSLFLPNSLVPCLQQLHGHAQLFDLSLQPLHHHFLLLHQNLAVHHHFGCWRSDCWRRLRPVGLGRRRYQMVRRLQRKWRCTVSMVWKRKYFISPWKAGTAIVFFPHQGQHVLQTLGKSGVCDFWGDSSGSGSSAAPWDWKKSHDRLHQVSFTTFPLRFFAKKSAIFIKMLTEYNCDLQTFSLDGVKHIKCDGRRISSREPQIWGGWGNKTFKGIIQSIRNTFAAKDGCYIFVFECL